MALLAAATSGNMKFFLGTDSAPHSVASKQSACGCAGNSGFSSSVLKRHDFHTTFCVPTFPGVFTGHAAIELYAEAFDSVGAISKLEGFASLHGARFYGLQVKKNLNVQSTSVVSYILVRQILQNCIC